MAGYSFETITQEQAAAFTANDYLFFQSATAQDVTVSPFSGNFGASGTNVSYGGKTITFPDTLATASQANHILFTDNSHLIIGSNTAGDALGTAGATTSSVIYALGGNDTVTLGTATTVADYVYGGVGDDTIGTATSDGNYHIYGNAGGSPAALTGGQTDVDTIVVGSGSSYIQGNAGADNITAGTATSTGYNRIFGGADNDTITINGAVGAHAAVNGNKGNDIINVEGDGTNMVRGGMGDDTITQTGGNHSTLQGDVGSDTLVVSAGAGHVAVLSGGSDADTFDFSATGAGTTAHLDATGASVAAGTTGSTDYYQEITDFLQGTDHIVLPTAVATNAEVGYAASANTVFGSVADAATFAATQVGTGGVVVSSLAVGTASANSTYLFYDDNGAGANTADTLGVIHLDGISASSVTAATFG